MITSKSGSEIGALLRRRECSVREVAQAFLSRIESHDHLYNAFITTCAGEWSDWADHAQGLLDRGEGGPLTGVPIAFKDNMSTCGVRTTCASKILDDYIPPFDATVVERCREHGLVMLGKTNLDEFAMGTSNENSVYGPVRNPWDRERSPGGSSGGSAAAVTANLVPLALGSDTGGSIRQPASLCGVVGFKPTYGRVSRYGLVAFGSSLDQIGPFAQSVEDVAHLASVISGHDPREATSIPNGDIGVSELKQGSLKGKRIALPKELFSPSAEPGILAAVDGAIQALKAEGVEFVKVSIPEIELGVTTYYVIAPAEASSNLARFDGVRYGPRLEGAGHVGTVAATRGALFGHEVKQRIITGTYVLSAGYYDAYYVRAQLVRAKMAAGFEAVFETCDAVLGPTSPVVAFKLGSLNDDPLKLKLLDYCTIPANMGGFPAISVPCGFSEGLPVGLQLMSRVQSDEALLQLAYCVEQALGTPTHRPDLP